MTDHLKHFMQGVGSVLAIAPDSRFERFVPRQSDSDNLRDDLYRIGADMQKIIEAQHVKHASQPRV